MASIQMEKIAQLQSFGEWSSEEYASMIVCTSSGVRMMRTVTHCVTSSSMMSAKCSSVMSCFSLASTSSFVFGGLPEMMILADRLLRSSLLASVCQTRFSSSAGCSSLELSSPEGMGGVKVA